MKRMVFGVMLFVSGFLAIFMFIKLSITNPATFHDAKANIIYVGLDGLLKAHGLTFVFILSCIICLGGFIICFIEVFKEYFCKSKKKN